MRRNRLFLLALLLSGLACTPATHVVEPGCDQEGEQYAVYSVIISSMYEGFETIVISDTTEVIGLQDLESIRDYLSRELTSAPADLVDDFLTRNQISSPVEAQFSLSARVILITEDQLQAVFEGDGWTEFYQRYPGSQGTMYLSLVSLDQSCTRALAGLGNQSHYLSGAGYYIYLEKVLGNWTIRQSALAWIS